MKFEWCDDKQLAERIKTHLQNDEFNKYCLVDAYYFDFSGIPNEIKDKYNIYRDAYLIIGITQFGEIEHKWIHRWEFENDI